MERRFPKKMYLLNKNGCLALATAMLEGSVTNERLQELTDQHPRDITFLLKKRVKEGFLAARNKGRWSSYTLAPENSAKEHSSLPHKDGSLPHKDVSLPYKEDSFPHKNSSSQHNGVEAPQGEDILLPEPPATETNGTLPDIVQEIRGRQRSSSDKMEKAILLLCKNRYVMPRELAELLQRNIKTLRNQYISKLVCQGKLVLQFTGQRTHPAQPISHQ